MSNESIVQPKVEKILEIHTLVVFKQTSVGNPDLYMWRDERDPIGFGPFFTLEGCLQHYAKALKDLNQFESLKHKGNVIDVDFVNKKRY